MYIGYRGREYPMPFQKNQDISMLNFIKIEAVV